MTYLLLSDIHANLDALEAVLAESRRCYRSILALGELVGYGAEPNRVLDWARANTDAVVRGNQNKACAGGSLQNFNRVASTAAQWTRGRLIPQSRAYLKRLPRGPLHVGNGNGGFDLSHGSPRDEASSCSRPGTGNSCSRHPSSPFWPYARPRRLPHDVVLELDPFHKLHRRCHQSYW
jgi:hypothetical protein